MSDDDTSPSSITFDDVEDSGPEPRPGGVVRICPTDTDWEGNPIAGWEAKYVGRHGGGALHGPATDKVGVLHWAAQQPAMEWLIQDPETGEWSPWSPETADTCEIKIYRVPPIPCPDDTFDDGTYNKALWVALWTCGEMSGAVESYDKEYVMAWVRARMAPATVHMYAKETWPET